jgi:hypothetical protein
MKRFENVGIVLARNSKAASEVFSIVLMGDSLSQVGTLSFYLSDSFCSQYACVFVAFADLETF